MKNQFARTTLFFGDEGMQRLQKSRVAVFGIGGVGGHLVEALVRSGVGEVDIIDNDCFCETNLNRQIFALHSTIGQDKTEAAKQRLLDINPDVKINIFNTFFLPENADCFDFSNYSYVADAVDTISAKLEIIKRANAVGVPVISAMGAGNKLDATALEVSDIFKTSVCPLARVMRRLCKENGIKELKVVYSKEPPFSPPQTTEYLAELKSTEKRAVPASNAFVPSVCGLIMAGEIINDLTVAKG